MKGCLPFGSKIGKALPTPPPDVPPKAPRQFFGQMVPGDFLQYPSGTPWTDAIITSPFGLIRTWDMGAVPYQIIRGNLDGINGILNFAAARQLEIMYCFGWHKDLTPWELCIPGTQIPDPEAWASLVNRILDLAAGKIRIFEMWNEPAVGELYLQGGTAAQLLSLSRIGAELIWARVPGSIVLTPSFNALGHAYGTAFADEYLRLMRADGRRSADGIAFHSYEDVIADHGRMKELARRHGFGHLPLHLTETLVTPEILAHMAREGVRSVVHNSHIPGQNALNANEGLGISWTASYDRMVA